MVRLVAKSPAHKVLPIEIGACRLEEARPEAMTWLAPFKGQEARVSNALNAATSCTFPGPNQVITGDSAHAISMAPGEALIVGASLEIDGAACVDQSDGWAVLRLSGGLTRDVLARLTPLDIRGDVFSVGHTARTHLGHMTATISRLDGETWEILVFRSMTRTAVDDIQRAMTSVVARNSL